MGRGVYIRLTMTSQLHWNSDVIKLNLIWLRIISQPKRQKERMCSKEKNHFLYFGTPVRSNKTKMSQSIDMKVITH